MKITNDHNQITVLLFPSLTPYDLPFTYSSILQIFIILLLLVTIIACAIYYKRIVRARNEYEDAKDLVEDITISFSRQVQKQNDALITVTKETLALSASNQEVAKRIEKYEAQTTQLSEKIKSISNMEHEISAKIETVNKKMVEAKDSQEKVLQRIIDIEKTRNKKSISEAQIDAAIPIRKEKALAPLTETELNVLQILVKEGSKTAPEIRANVKLTREHTARLMKKLYEDGYLERDTHKMPYTYRLKEEMHKILKRKEAKA